MVMMNNMKLTAVNSYVRMRKTLVGCAARCCAAVAGKKFSANKVKEKCLTVYLVYEEMLFYGLLCTNPI